MNSLGEQLRYWRTQKGFSQLRLAELAETSSRHVSFIETGRGHPSRALLIRLAQELEIPLRARNSLLESAGYSPQFGETGLSDPEMAQVRRVLEFILESSLPYPSMIIDRYWNVVMANESFLAVVRAFAAKPETFRTDSLNLMRVILHPDGIRPHIVNWSEFEPYMIGRVRRSLKRDPSDGQLQVLFEEITQYEGAAQRETEVDEPSVPRFLMPIHIAKGGVEIRMFTTIATLGAPQDITLQELFIESAFPADEATERYLRRHGHRN